MDIRAHDLLPTFYCVNPNSTLEIREDDREAVTRTLQGSGRYYISQMRSFFDNNALPGHLSPLNNYRRNTPLPETIDYVAYFNSVAQQPTYTIHMWAADECLFPDMGVFGFFRARVPVRKKCYYYMILATNILSFLENSSIENQENLSWWMSKVLGSPAGNSNYTTPNASRAPIEILNPSLNSDSCFSMLESIGSSSQANSPGHYNILHITIQAYVIAWDCVASGNWIGFWRIIAKLFQNRCPFRRPDSYSQDAGADIDYFYGQIVEHYVKTPQKDGDISNDQLIKMIDQNEYSLETLDKVYEFLSGKVQK